MLYSVSQQETYISQVSRVHCNKVSKENVRTQPNNYIRRKSKHTMKDSAWFCFEEK